MATYIGEACDDGNTVTESCAYGETSCTVCDASCGEVAGTTSYCGDGTLDAVNGERYAMMGIWPAIRISLMAR